VHRAQRVRTCRDSKIAARGEGCDGSRS